MIAMELLIPTTLNIRLVMNTPPRDNNNTTVVISPPLEDSFEEEILSKISFSQEVEMDSRSMLGLRIPLICFSNSLAKTIAIDFITKIIFLGEDPVNMDSAMCI